MTPASRGTKLSAARMIFVNFSILLTSLVTIRFFLIMAGSKRLENTIHLQKKKNNCWLSPKKSNLSWISAFLREKWFEIKDATRLLLKSIFQGKIWIFQCLEINLTIIWIQRPLSFNLAWRILTLVNTASMIYFDPLAQSLYSQPRDTGPLHGWYNFNEVQEARVSDSVFVAMHLLLLLRSITILSLTWVHQFEQFGCFNLFIPFFCYFLWFRVFSTARRNERGRFYRRHWREGRKMGLPRTSRPVDQTVWRFH